MAILSTLESSALDKTLICASKWHTFNMKMQNVELFNLKCVTYNPFLCKSIRFLSWVYRNQNLDRTATSHTITQF